MIDHHILIIGGTGVFGQRLVRHLARLDGIVLHVSSRDGDKAARFLDTLAGTAAELRAVALDCAVNLRACLRDIRPFLVVDCSGPFQGADYGTARAILEAGAHLVDLADAREYLANFAPNLDDIARQNNVFALTGASSTPTLSTSVATEMTAGWSRVDTIDICITPGGRSEVGRAVIAAILSYAGKDVPVWRDGTLSHATGWRPGGTVDIPGLGPRRVAFVETFDAEHLGPTLGVQSRVTFSAGLESRVEQWGIQTLAAVRNAGWIGALDRLIPVLLSARRLTRIPTSANGGMMVDITGLNAGGRQTRARWSLVARADHGPFIPILPAAALVRKALSGPVASGARFAHTALSLDDILREMVPYQITTQTSCSEMERGLFESVLGDADFAILPASVRAFHAADASPRWTGKADIQTARGLVSKALSWLFGFPSQGQDVPVSVSVDRHHSGETGPSERWSRTFADTVMTSDLDHQGGAILTETFAPFTFELGLRADDAGLHLPVIGWRLGKLRLPKVLAPRSQTSEYVDEQGRFRFDVRLSAPGIGLITHYQGWLTPKQTAQPSARSVA